MNVDIAPLVEGDGPEALEVNRACPIQADYRFTFERDPEFFRWPRRMFDSFRYLGAREDGRLVGYGMMAEKQGWTGSDWGRFGYGGDLRVLPERRRHGVGNKLSQALFAGVASEIDVGFSVVKIGNLPMEAYVERMKRESLIAGWEGRLLGPLHASNVLFVPPTEPRGFVVRPARRDDLEDLVELQLRAFEGRLFAPQPRPDGIGAALEGRVDPEGIGWPRFLLAERHGQLVGAVGLWDIDAMHRVRVLKRTWRAQVAAGGYRVLRLAHPELAPLPRDGQVFRSLVVVDVAIPNRDPDVLSVLLATAIRDHAGLGYHLLQVGLMHDDPLRDALRGFRTVRFDSHLGLWFRRGWLEDVGEQAVADPYVDLTLL